jgi:hypothetical protein
MSALELKLSQARRNFGGILRYTLFYYFRKSLRGGAPGEAGRLRGTGAQVVDICQRMQAETRRGGHAASCASQE